MNKLVVYKSLIHRLNSNSDKGFTLIELLVVIIIVGVLASIALANTIKQVAKAREVEGKNNLGILSRAQQAYHFETGSFSNSVPNLLGNSVISSEYFSFPDPTIASNSIVKHQAIAIDPGTDQVRNYATGIYFDLGIYNVNVCESTNGNVAVNVPDVMTDPCTNGGTKLR